MSAGAAARGTAAPGPAQGSGAGGGQADGPPAPRTRRWLRVALLALVAAGLVVALATWLRTLPAVEDFVARHPGTLPVPQGAPVGVPAWLAWQHALNAFFLLLVVRSGWLVRTVRRPPARWTPRPALARRGRAPQPISLHLWWHLTVDVLWVLNGLAFWVLLAVTGQWLRIVPTTGQVVPEALSAALQYASFRWPVEDGWVMYNALQMLAYTVVVYVAAPLAILTGLRMSPLWPSRPRLDRAYPVGLARAVHLPVMLFFVAFVVVHVALVLTTGALDNLSHMYAASPDSPWLGLALFLVSLAVLAGGWFLARPALLRPLAALTGTVSR